MGKQWKQWQTLFFWAPKSLQMVTASMKLRHLFLGRKAMTNLDSISESRDMTLPTKVHLIKAMFFPIVMYGCESWIIKKLSAKEMMLLNGGVGETLESPLDYKIKPVNPKGNQSWIFVGCWSWSSNTLAAWCKELTHWKRPWCWERLRAGGEGDDIGWNGWMASLILPTWVWVNSRSWWCTGRPGMLQSMGLQSQTRLSNRTELNWCTLLF